MKTVVIGGVVFQVVIADGTVTYVPPPSAPCPQCQADVKVNVRFDHRGPQAVFQCKTCGPVEPARFVNEWLPEPASVESNSEPVPSV